MYNQSYFVLCMRMCVAMKYRIPYTAYRDRTLLSYQDQRFARWRRHEYNFHLHSLYFIVLLLLHSHALELPALHSDGTEFAWITTPIIGWRLG